MKILKLSKLLSFLLFILVCSCTDDSAKIYADWKTDNETYYTNMKDSIGYSLSIVPTVNGASSFYYKITKPGIQNSDSPLATDIVTVNYRGKLINGKIFSQTFSGDIIGNDTTTTVTFNMSPLLKGWILNLITMKTGEVRKIVLPQELAYGTIQTDHTILPYSTTLWEIQLVRFSHIQANSVSKFKK